MKRFLSVFLILAIFCSFVIPVNAASPTVSVSSSKTAVDTGDTVTITVKLSSGSNLGAIDLSVKYSTSEFQYVSGSVSTGGLFSMENTVDTKAGSIRYLGVTDGVENGAGTLVSFKLKVLKYGGKISVSVGEAIDGGDKDVTSSVKTSGATLKCAHGNMKWKVTKPATCTEKGTKTGTCPCGYETTDTIPKTEHTVGKYTVTKKPTCTEKGTKKAVCTTCNKEYIEEIKATGHTYGKWTVEKEATATEKGLKVAVCTACGDKKEQTIPVIGSTETTTVKESESSTESSTKTSTEESTDPTTFEEESTDTPSTEEPSTEELSTEEPSTQASSGNVEEEKPSTAKTVVLTILGTLGVEALIGLIVFLILKQRKKEKEQ